MMTTLDRFIDPANYHPEAVAAADAGDVADVAPEFLIIRLGLELRRANRCGAEQAIARLVQDNRLGHEQFQMMTAQLILALWTREDAVIFRAFDDWLGARKTSKSGWMHEVLEAPELAPFVAKLEPAKLVVPPRRRAPISKADRALVRDFKAAREQAVTENLQWLRELGVTGTVKSIAKAYRITFANHYLREITLTSKRDLPDLIISLDEKGAMLGSFIAH